MVSVLFSEVFPEVLSLPHPILAETNPWLIVGISVVAGVMGMGLVKLIDYLRRRDADKEAAQILERAAIEADSRRKEAAVEAREMALQEKGKVEQENTKIRNELHQRQRQLDKSEDGITQRTDQLLKQEKMVENNQRRLAESIDDATRRQKELDDLLDGRPCIKSADSVPKTPRPGCSNAWKAS